MQVKDDGKASFFAVMDKSMTAQRERVAAKRAEKKAAEKKAAKKAEKKETQEKRAEKRAEKKADEKAREKENIEDYTDDDWGEDGDYELIQADSAEELIRMMEDWAMARQSDTVRTSKEELVGSHVDFRA